VRSLPGHWAELGAASPGHHEDIPPGAAVSFGVSLQWEATDIKYLAYVFKRVIVSIINICNCVSKGNSLIACSMARKDHPQIFLSYKDLISELCHKRDNGKADVFLEDLDD